MLYHGLVEPHFRLYDAPAKPLLRQLRLPSIAAMIRQESASMVYKAINGQAPTVSSVAYLQ